MQNLTGKITGSTLTAAEWDQLPQEVQGVISALGITLSSGDLNQLNAAVAGYSAVGQFFTGAGAADAYTANAPSPRTNPPARQEGMIIRFQAAANNTGACTLNAFGTGVADIKLSDGTTDPAADDIVAGKDVTVIDRVTYFELIRTGQTKITVISVSNAAWTPQPDTKVIEFTAIGAGGGAGGVSGQGSGTAATSGGGGAGAAAIKTVSVIDASYSITIGAGGSGGAAGNNAGATGGTTTVIDNGPGTNVSLSCPGGAGGFGDLGSSGYNSVAGGTGAIATGGDVNVRGGDGTSGVKSSGFASSFGNGGSSILGGGPRGGSSGDGFDADTYGAAGGGVATRGVSSNFSGGDGHQGVVIIREFF